MQTVTITLNNISPETAKSILAGLTSTDGPASENPHTSQSSAKPATKTGKTSPKKAAPAVEDESSVDEEYSEDEDFAADAEETEEVDATVPQVQKLMAKLATKKDAATCKKLLAKYKVKKTADLSQPKLNQLATEIQEMLD